MSEETYVERIQRRLSEINSGPRDDRAWRELIFMVDSQVRERHRAEVENDALSAELQLYRPRRCDKPAAPLIAEHCYVFTAKQPFVCAAKEIRKVFQHEAWKAWGYLQESYTPDQKTICGRQTNYPVSERFTSGGWPRLHELCPDCVKLLTDKGLFDVERLRQEVLF